MTVIEYGGSKCLGCGYCCMQAPCIRSQMYYAGAYQPCPGLKWDENADRHWCALVLKSDESGLKFMPTIRVDLGIESGCCSGLNNWRYDIKDRRNGDAR